jgi:transmembrane sensor
MKINKMPINHFKENNTRAVDHRAEQKSKNPLATKEHFLTDMIWKEAGKYPIFKQIDTYADWKLVSDRVFDKIPLSYRKIPWHVYFLRAAALVILAFGLSIGVYRFFIALNKTAPAGFISQEAEQVKDLILPDGSTVALNKGSKLTYREGFGIQSRDVILEGEALFNVVPRSTLPFKVYINESVVEVTGTSFSVSDMNGEVKVSVLSGKVILSSTDGDQKKISIAANQSGYVLTNNELKIEEGISVNVLSWKTGHLIFDQTRLDSALIDIAHHFGKELSYESDLKEEITAEFQNQPLSEILNELKLVAGLQFDTTGTALIVRK